MFEKSLVILIYFWKHNTVKDISGGYFIRDWVKN